MGCYDGTSTCRDVSDTRLSIDRRTQTSVIIPRRQFTDLLSIERFHELQLRTRGAVIFVGGNHRADNTDAVYDYVTSYKFPAFFNGQRLLPPPALCERLVLISDATGGCSGGGGDVSAFVDEVRFVAECAIPLYEFLYFYNFGIFIRTKVE